MDEEFDADKDLELNTNEYFGTDRGALTSTKTRKPEEVPVLIPVWTASNNSPRHE